MVTLPDSWATVHAGDVKVVRDDLVSMKENTVLLRSGKSLKTDFVVMCTGWGDHFAIFDRATKAELGLPLYSDCSPLLTPSTEVSWEPYDNAAEKSGRCETPNSSTGSSATEPTRQWNASTATLATLLPLNPDPIGSQG